MSAPSLSASICGLLQILTRGADPGAVIHLRRHAGNALGCNEAFVRVRDVGDRWIPLSVLRLLETDPSPWAASVALRRDVGATITSLSAASITFDFKRQFVNPTAPSSPFGKQWCWPEAEIDATIERVTTILPPTIVIDSRHALTFAWALTEIHPTRHNDSATKRLFVALAERLGATVPGADVQLGDLELQLPGFVIANASALGEVTTCRVLDLSRVYPLDTIWAAATGTPTAAPAASPATPAPAPRRRAAKE